MLFTVTKSLELQLNKYETDPYFLQVFQSNTSVCLIISGFCKSCEPICEPKITPVLYHLENLQKVKQKQFHVQYSAHKSYKTRKWTFSCIGNFEENMDLSRIYLAVLQGCLGTIFESHKHITPKISNPSFHLKVQWQKQF